MSSYPTRYSKLSNSEVDELYRSESWADLNQYERRDALQELANRAATECGNQPREVILEGMQGPQYGGFNEDAIYVNKNLVENGELSVQYEDGKSSSYRPLDTNAQLMDTIHHENYHAYQFDAINGYVKHDNAAEVEQWRANWPNETYVSEGPLYRLQSLEKSAFNHGETRTKEAFAKMEAKYGIDAGFQEYVDGIERDSYEKALDEAVQLYGDENIEKTVNEDIMAKYQELYGESQVGQHTPEIEKSHDTGGNIALPQPKAGEEKETFSANDIRPLNDKSNSKESEQAEQRTTEAIESAKQYEADSNVRPQPKANENKFSDEYKKEIGADNSQPSNNSHSKENAPTESREEGLSL